jgi:pyruvate dehydrogenase E2 component (dihydrolipoamide acetyltransferase)
MADPAATIGVRGETRLEQPSPRQRAIARRSAESRATVPDVELSAEVAMQAARDLCAREGCSITAALIRACALALRAVPRANGAYRDGQFELYSRVNVGLTVATDDAYVTPTVFDADRKSLAQCSTEIDELRRRAPAGELTPPELSGSTFTLTDLGAYGISAASTHVTPSQAAALTAGAIREVPLIRDRQLSTTPAVTLTLACDHRILFWAQAAALLSKISTLLSEARL